MPPEICWLRRKRKSITHMHLKNRGRAPAFLPAQPRRDPIGLERHKFSLPDNAGRRTQVSFQILVGSFAGRPRSPFLLCLTPRAGRSIAGCLATILELSQTLGAPHQLYAVGAGSAPAENRSLQIAESL